MVDKVHPLKYETTEHGGSTDGYPTEVNPTEDYIVAKGLAFGDSDDHLIHLMDDEICFYDPEHGHTHLSDLITGSSTTRIARKNAITIDGSTYAIDEDTNLYQVTSGYFMTENTIVITNRNNAIANVRVAHVDGAIGSVVVADYLLYDTPFLPYETKTIYIPNIAASESILVRSDTVDVTFRLFGEVRSGTSPVKRLAAYDVSAANTNETALLTTSKITDLQYFICNRSPSNAATIRVALIDSNSLSNLADEDYELYEELVTANESKGYALGNGLDTANIFMIRSSSGDVNVVIYGKEYS